MPRNGWNTECSGCAARPSGVFCHLESLALDKLSHEKVSNSYKKGQVLFYQGNPPFGLYCINEGKVKITKTGSEGKETIVRIATTGDLLGHRSLFSDSPYTASAMVIEDAKICFINKKTIHDLIKSEPVLSLEIINRLSQDMGKAENMIASMAQRSIRERFAELLLVLRNSYGAQSSNGTRLDIRLTRDEMASIIGTTPESLIRLVTEFKNDGIIAQEGKLLFLKNEEKLNAYAHLEH